MKLLSNRVLIRNLMSKVETGVAVSDEEMNAGEADMAAALSSYPHLVSAAFVDKNR